MIKKISFLITLLFAFVFNASAQEVEMADSFRADGKIYVVVAVLLIVFLGISIFLFSIDRKLNKIEKSLKK